MQITMQTLISQTRQEWLAQRRRGIGGSDAACVLGLSPWKTPYALWLEKTGQSADDDADSAAMLWGRTLEPVIRAHYCAQTGRTVQTPQCIIAHPDYPWMLANVDGLTDCGKVLEIKTARFADDWGEAGSDEVPDAYALQVQHYMAVTGRAAADIAVLIGGSDFRIYHVPENRELQSNLMEAEAAFWQLVQSKTPPAPTTFAEAQQRWLAEKGATSKSAAAGDDILPIVRELRQLRHEIKDGEVRKAQYELQIIEYMHNIGCDTLLDETGRAICTNKPIKGARRFNAKAFAVEHAKLYAQYLHEAAPYMRFAFKN